MPNAAAATVSSSLRKQRWLPLPSRLVAHTGQTAEAAAAAADLAALVAAAIAGLVANATMLACVNGLCCSPAELLAPLSELLAAPCPKEF